MLTKNLDRLKPLMQDQGHWGGIHAVYNIYNATRLVELTQFARDRRLAVHWQSLYQPECLDPSRLGTRTVELAKQEIGKLLDSQLCLDNERQFFETVLSNLSGAENLHKEFATHIADMEQIYHTDQQGQFKKLWPELSYLMD